MNQYEALGLAFLVFLFLGAIRSLWKGNPRPVRSAISVIVPLLAMIALHYVDTSGMSHRDTIVTETARYLSVIAYVVECIILIFRFH